MKRNPNVIREGDWVEIADPRVVVRVGYPKSVDDYKREVETRFQEQLRAMFPDRTFARGLAVTERARGRVVQELAYMLAKHDGFGGPDRTIHLRDEPSLKSGDRVYVNAVKMCVTGRYYPPSSGYSYYDEYEPGGLDNQKSQRLLGISDGAVFIGGKSDLWIPASHVKKIAAP